MTSHGTDLANRRSGFRTQNVDDSDRSEDLPALCDQNLGVALRRIRLDGNDYTLSLHKNVGSDRGMNSIHLAEDALAREIAKILRLFRR